MNYKLDADGYISAVSFGCVLDGCTEYTGTIPVGYNTLVDWSTYACINAYYIDSNGNLALDTERLAEIRQKEAQERIDNAPVLRKDLYGSDEVLDSQYLKQTETGEVIVLEDIKTIAPKVKATGISSSSLHIYTHSKNMMRCKVAEQTISGVAVSMNESGSINLIGTATADIELTVAGSETNTTPLFALKGGYDYYLYVGGYECELRYYDGETTSQQYVGASGVLNLSQSIVVTQVIVKIPKGVTPPPYPHTYALFYDNGYQGGDANCKTLSIDFSDILSEFPDGTTVDYVLIENGRVSVSIEGVEIIVGSGNVGLYSDYSVIYALEDATLEVEYSTKNYDGNIGGLLFTESGLTSTVEAWINPTVEDIQTISSVLAGKITVTDAMRTIMDINCDGEVTISDLLAWQRILLGTYTIDYYVSTYGYKPVLSDVTLTISPDDSDKVVHMSGTNSFGTYVESRIGINDTNVSGTVTGGVVKTTSGANLDTVKDNATWKSCTVTANTSVGSFYNNSQSAKYRYDNNVLEICVRGTFVTKTTVAKGTTLMTVSGLPIAIPTSQAVMLWDETSQTWRRVSMDTAGAITLANNTSISSGAWLSGTTLDFKIFRT